MKTTVQKSYKIFLLLSFALAISLFVADRSFAMEINSRTSLAFDETLADVSQTKYKYPEKILVSKIENVSGAIFSTNADWIDALYYYSITRYGFADIPYHYIIDRDGKVYQPRSGWVGSIPELESNEGAVLIGYLSDGNDLTDLASVSFVTLLNDLSAKYGFSPSDVQTVTLSIVSKQISATPLPTATTEGTTSTESSTTTASSTIQTGTTVQSPQLTLSKLAYRPLTGTFSTNIASVARSASLSGVATQRNLTAEITNVQNSAEVRTGDTVPITLTVTNKNDYPWFTNSEYVYVVTANQRNSPLVINGAWDSFSKPTHIGEQIVLPGQSVTLSFNVYIAVPPVNNYVSSYKLITQSGKVLASSDFNTSFKINTGSLSFARVAVKGADSIFVRKCNSYSCKEIGYVRNGQVFAILGEDNGWYKIKYDGESTGWVMGRNCVKF